MKINKFILMIILGVYLTNLGAVALCQQRSYSKKELIKLWNKNKKKYPPSKNAIELGLKSSFPSEELEKKDIYLWNARYLTNDLFGNIYVSDLRFSHILKFDLNGKFINRISQKGQGPGELQNPHRIFVTKKHLIVNDNGNYRLQFFNLDGNYVKSFKIFKTYLEITGNKEGLIYGAPMRISKKSPLIDVLNEEGKLLFSFGKALNFNKWAKANRIKLATSQRDEVFVAFEHFPIVRKYSKKGELLAEYRIEHSVMRKREKENIEILSREKRGEVTFHVIYSIRAGKEGFYILFNYPYLQIMEFDERGNLRNDYWVETSYDYSPMDFIVQEFNNKIFFYILIKGPENRIDVFRPKTYQIPD